MTMPNSLKDDDMVPVRRWLLKKLARDLSDLGLPAMAATAHQLSLQESEALSRALIVEGGGDRALDTSRRRAAVETLLGLGYTWHGGQQWKPPLGPRPKFIDAIESLSRQGGDAVYQIRHESGGWMDQDKASHDWWNDMPGKIPERRILFTRASEAGDSADAARYRFMRDVGSWSIEVWPGLGSRLLCNFTGMTFDRIGPNSSDFDAAIDKATAAAKRTGE